MKTIIILLILIISSVVYAEDFPIMLEVQSKVKIPNDFRDGVEEALTKKNYSLIDEGTQNEALENQRKQRESDCYDNACLVDTGKMLAAKALIVVEVEVKSETAYKFKVRFIDFEKGTTTKTISKYYEQSLANYKELMKFGKDLTFSLFKGVKTEAKKEKLVVKVEEKKDKKVDEKSKEEIDKLKKEITKLNNKINKVRINPRKENKASLSFNIGSSSMLGLKYSYFLSPYIELSGFAGFITGLGLNIHLFTNTTKGHTLYIGVDAGMFLLNFSDESPTTFYPHLGYQYQSQANFIFSIDVGQMTAFSDSIPFAGIKIGYVFD